MSSDLRDELMDDFERALRTALTAEAETVTGSPDALADIRRRIASGGETTTPVRPPRSPWLGPRGAILATAAVAALVTVLTLVLVGGGSNPGGSKPGGSKGIGSKGLGVARQPNGAAAFPAHFYAITDGATVDEYATATGRHLRRFTPQQSEVQLSDLQLSADRLYFVQGGLSGCGNSLRNIDVRTGATATTATSARGHQIVGYTVWGNQAALVEHACKSGPNEVVIRNLPQSFTERTMRWVGVPPDVSGNPAWTGRGSLDYIWRAGNAANVLSLDPVTDKTLTTGSPVCLATSALPQTLTPANGGARGADVLMAGEQGGTGVVVRCAPGASGGKPLFSLPGQRPIEGLSVADSGAVLVTTASGELWRWNAHHLHRVPTRTKVSSASW